MSNDKNPTPRQYMGVMVSSTFTDLKQHRTALIDAINGQGLHEVAMENDSAKLVDVIDSSIQMVRDGAAYIGVISHKYGQTPLCPSRNPRHLSITELEFNEAQRLERPTLLFIMGDEHPVTKGDIETDPTKREKLNVFRERAKQMRPDSPVHRVYATFNNLDEFVKKGIHAAANLRRYLDEKDSTAALPHITSHAATVPAVHDSRSDDSIGFIYTFRPGQLPHGLAVHVDGDLVDRKRDLETLTERLSPNSIIPIEGVLQSGKTALVAKLLSSDSVRRKLTSGSQPLAEVSVLYIDLEVAIGPRPVLRRLAYALGELKRIPDAEDSEAATLGEIRAQLLHEILFARLCARAPLAVLDDVDRIPLTDNNLADLRALLEFTPFRQGAILAVTSRPVSQKIVERTGREIKKPLEVGPFSQTEGEQLLTKLLGDSRMAAETITYIKDAPELLLPGAFVEGIAAFKSQLNVGSIENKPATLANTILECASDDVLKTLKATGCDFATPSEAGTLGHQVSIMAMAVLARQAVAEEHLSAARLPVEFFQRLRNQGWLQERDNGFCLPGIICAALRVQVEAILKGSAGEKGCSELADAVDALIQAVASQTAHDDETILDEVLEEAISWLERRQTGDSLLADRLWSAFLPHTADDLVAPISSNGSAELLKRLGEPGKPLSLATAIAKLVLEARVGNDAKQFLKSLKTAIDFATRSSGITVYQL
jgi:hypothetical protein